MGKASDWSKDKLTTFEPRDFWAPDFKIMVTDTTAEEGEMGVKPTHMLCEVLPKGIIKWGADGLKVAGLASESAAGDALSQYRRRRQ